MVFPCYALHSQVLHEVVVKKVVHGVDRAGRCKTYVCVFIVFFFFMQSELKAAGKDKKEQGRFSPTGKRN